MASRSWIVLLKWPVAAMVLGGLLYGAYEINDWVQRERAVATVDEAPKRVANSIKLGAKLAEARGVKDEPAQAVVWYQRVTVYGVVVPNPQATVEVRSAFAGTLRADPDHPWPVPGRLVRAGQSLGRVDIRAGPQERLDIQTKLADARARHDGAEEVLKIQRERLDRLLVQPGVESLVRQELDNARVRVAEARTQVVTAKAAVDLWQKALDILDKRGDRPTSDWTEPLTAAADGEVTELAARPGMTVEAGGLIARLVDFRRPLVRLELPPEVLAAGPPPPEVDLFAVPAPTQPLGSHDPVEATATGVPATLIGPAGNVDAASQFAGYWYEVKASKNTNGGVSSAGLTWRPGLFVQAHLKTSGAKSHEAVSVPSTALLFHLGRTLVYVRIGAGRYQRREVRVLGREGDRWVLDDGAVTAGEPVVYRQAQVLLSEEFKPQGDVDND
jgi:multidrug efflux pump subunit AcrA (membrane-fusion protein)